jgi:hypothetical protein
MAETTKTIFIECDCMTHVLKVQSEIETFADNQVYRQDINLAMFSYGEHVPKDSFWKRINFCWKYLRKGTIYSDQLCLNEDEALKLADFINANVVKRAGIILNDLPH